MSKTLKYILTAFAAAILSAGVIFAFKAGGDRSADTVCRRVEVKVDDSSSLGFVNAAGVKKVLEKEYGQYLGANINSLDIARMESILDSKSAVSKSEVYVSKNGILHIYIRQLKPVLRFQKGSLGFYCDGEGNLFPVQNGSSAHVMTVSGSVPLNFRAGYKGKAESDRERSWMEGVLRLNDYISKSNLWRKDIAGMSVRSNGDLVLIPRVGDEKFIIGIPDNLESKFRKIQKYYTCIVPARGNYASVNLKYDGQIICRK